MRTWLRFDGLTRLLLAVVIALAMLAYYSRFIVNWDDLALGEETVSTVETWNSRRITASNSNDIAKLVADVGEQRSQGEGSPGIVAWLGNSQLHSINQFKNGDHLAPYWLAQTSNCGGCVLPLGLSLPNASLQEHLVIALHAIKRLPLALLTLELVFDDLREDGFREELAVLLTPDASEELARSAVGQELLAAWTASRNQPKAGEKTESGLAGFHQEPIEKAIDDSLGYLFPLWGQRGNLRSRFLYDLYVTRNRVFGITPSSVRRMIPARYGRNMRAFDAIVAATRRAGIPLLAYIAPIRGDLPIPYDVPAYQRWIGDLQAKAAAEGFTVVDFEKLVPNHQWGTVGKEIDFMHFQGNGHKLLAAALWPEMKRLMMTTGHSGIARSNDGQAR